MRRTARILAGYFAASLVAAILIPAALTFVATFGDSVVTYEGSPVARPSTSSFEWRMFGTVMLIYVLTFAVLAAPVAVPAILLAEYRAITSPVYYGSIGLLAGAIPISWYKIGGFTLFFGLLGILPGLSYWLIAGRRAGD